MITKKSQNKKNGTFPNDQEMEKSEVPLRVTLWNPFTGDKFGITIDGGFEELIVKGVRLGVLSFLPERVEDVWVKTKEGVRLCDLSYLWSRQDVLVSNLPEITLELSPQVENEHLTRLVNRVQTLQQTKLNRFHRLIRRSPNDPQSSKPKNRDQVTLMLVIPKKHLSSKPLESLESLFRREEMISFQGTQLTSSQFLTLLPWMDDRDEESSPLQLLVICDTPASNSRDPLTRKTWMCSPHLTPERLSRLIFLSFEELGSKPDNYAPMAFHSKSVESSWLALLHPLAMEWKINTLRLAAEIWELHFAFHQMTLPSVPPQNSHSHFDYSYRCPEWS